MLMVMQIADETIPFTFTVEDLLNAANAELARQGYVLNGALSTSLDELKDAIVHATTSAGVRDAGIGKKNALGKVVLSGACKRVGLQNRVPRSTDRV